MDNLAGLVWTLYFEKTINILGFRTAYIVDGLFRIGDEFKWRTRKT
jgi:hypothetical protein